MMRKLTPRENRTNNGRSGVGSRLLLSRGRGLKFVLPMSGGIRPPDPLLVIAAYIMRIMHFTSVKVTWRLFANSSFPLDNIRHSSLIDVRKCVDL